MKDSILTSFYLIGFILPMSLIVPSSEIYASQFTVQQFPDDLNDLVVLSSSPSNIDSCKTNHNIPDITGVSYSSDGKILDTTIWLSEALNPTVNAYTNISIQRVNITEGSDNFSFSDSHILIKDINEMIPLNNTNNMIEGTYNFSSGSISIYEKDDPIFDLVIFWTVPSRFESYYSEYQIENVFASFSNLENPTNDKSIGNFSVYNKNGITVHYPESWLVDGDEDGLPTFYPPQVGHIHYIATIQTISDPSYGNGYSDYKLVISWDWKNREWSKTLYQLSPQSEPPIPSKELLKSHVSVPLTNVDLDLNLEEIGSPRNYAVFSYLVVHYFTATDSCVVADPTLWVHLPPPSIDINVSPTYLHLRPGDEKKVTVLVNSSTITPLEIFFPKRSLSGELITGFSPETLSISSFGKASSTLQIRVPMESSSPNVTRDYVIPVVGEVTFKQTDFLNVSGERVNGSIHNLKTSPEAFLQIKVEDPLSDLEKLAESFSPIVKPMAAIIEPVQGILVMVAAIVGSIISIGVGIRRRSYRQSHQSK